MYTIFISNIYYDLQSFNFNLNLKLKILSHLKRSPISYENLFVVKFHWQILYKCRNMNCQLPIKSTKGELLVVKFTAKRYSNAADQYHYLYSVCVRFLPLPV